MLTRTELTKIEKYVIRGLNVYPILKVIPFISGIIFTVVYVTVREINSIEFYNSFSLATIIIVLILAVIWAEGHEATVPASRLIKSIIESGRYGLGQHYRINIMEPSDPLDAQTTGFYIVFATQNMDRPRSYDGKFTPRTAGVGDAYVKGDTCITYEENINNELDSYPKIIWSIPIKRQNRKNTVAILNIDTNISGNDFKCDEISKVRECGEQMAEMILPKLKI